MQINPEYIALFNTLLTTKEGIETEPDLSDGSDEQKNVKTVRLYLATKALEDFATAVRQWEGLPEDAIIDYRTGFVE